MLSIANSPRVQQWRQILIMAWPLILANSFWNLQLTIDRVFLGHYSTDALAAAMAVMGIFWTPMALVQQTASYLMVFVAQFFGAKRYDQVGAALWQSIYLSIAGGLLFLLLIPCARPLFTWMGHPPAVRELEIALFQALCFSALPTALVAAAGAFFTGLGNTQPLMWINCVGLVANAIFGYLLIFGKMGFPALGVTGAGIARTLASCCSAVYGLYLVFQKKYEDTYKVRSSWHLNLDLQKRFIRYGVPSGMQWALEGLAFAVFLIIIGKIKDGEAALAATGVAVTVMMLAILPALGIAQAVSVQVGQHLGENKPELAERSTIAGLQVSAMYILCMGLSFAIIPDFYLSWFQNNENPLMWEKIASMAKTILLFVALFTNFDSMNLNLSFALKGAGDTRFVTLVALCLPWPLMVAPTWLVMNWENAIYWAWGACSVHIITQAMIFCVRFRIGKWKQMRVIS